MRRGEWLFFVVVALVVGGIGGMLSARIIIHGRIVTAERFVLIDGTKRIRAVLDQDEGGNPRLFFFDEKGGVSMGLMNSSEGNRTTALNFYSTEGNPYLSLGVSNNQPTLGFFDDDMRPRSILRLEPNGDPLLMLFNEEGASCQIMGNKDSIALMFRDKENAHGSSLGLIGGHPQLSLDHTEGMNIRFVNDAERVGLFFSDRNRKVRGILGMDTNEEAFLTFLGEDTQRIWRAP